MLIKSFAGAIIIMTTLQLVISVTGQDQSATISSTSDKSTVLYARQGEAANQDDGKAADDPLAESRREEAQRIQKRIDAAVQELRVAKSDSDRNAAGQKLMQALGEDYDARLAEYETDLDAMEKRLVELRKKLVRRREARAEMIKLRMQVLDAEADDLGWPARSTSYSGAGTVTWSKQSDGQSTMIQGKFEVPDDK